METIDRYLTWLDSEITTERNYHNHKETMAWVATALYVPGIIALGYLIDIKFKDVTITCWQYLLLFLIFASLASLVFIFVYRQFKLRSRSADEVNAFIELLNEVSKDYSVVNLWNENSDIQKDKH